MGTPTRKVKSVGDETTGRVQKFQTVHVNNDNTPTVVYNANSLESKKRRSLAQPGIDFVTSYYNSPGFTERLNKHNESLKDTGYVFSPSDKLALNYVNYGIGKYVDTPAYDHETKTINTGPTNTTYGGFTYGMPFIVSHEGGHAIDYSMKRLDPKKGTEVGHANYELPYSGSYPIFQNNKKLKSIKDKYAKGLINKGYSENQANKVVNMRYDYLVKTNQSDIEHDARARESYADYIGFLQMLNQDGIHDARKSNIDGSNTFTKEKLDKFKEKHPDWQNMRFFQNFDEEDIIRMPNEVASNYSNKKRSLEEQGYYLA